MTSALRVEGSQIQPPTVVFPCRHFCLMVLERNTDLQLSTVRKTPTGNLTR
jgi:hypothetical protein